jgi:hypothetical protein
MTEVGQNRHDGGRTCLMMERYWMKSLLLLLLLSKLNVVAWCID